MIDWKFGFATNETSTQVILVDFLQIYIQGTIKKAVEFLYVFAQHPLDYYICILSVSLQSNFFLHDPSLVVAM